MCVSSSIDQIAHTTEGLIDISPIGILWESNRIPGENFGPISEELAGTKGQTQTLPFTEVLTMSSRGHGTQNSNGRDVLSKFKI